MVKKIHGPKHLFYKIREAWNLSEIYRRFFPIQWKQKGNRKTSFLVNIEGNLKSRGGATAGTKEKYVKLGSRSIIIVEESAVRNEKVGSRRGK